MTTVVRVFDASGVVMQRLGLAWDGPARLLTLRADGSGMIAWPVTPCRLEVDLGDCAPLPQHETQHNMRPDVPPPHLPRFLEGLRVTSAWGWRTAAGVVVAARGDGWEVAWLPRHGQDRLAAWWAAQEVR